MVNPEALELGGAFIHNLFYTRYMPRPLWEPWSHWWSAIVLWVFGSFHSSASSDNPSPDFQSFKVCRAAKSYFRRQTTFLHADGPIPCFTTISDRLAYICINFSAENIAQSKFTAFSTLNSGSDFPVVINSRSLQEIQQNSVTLLHLFQHHRNHIFINSRHLPSANILFSFIQLRIQPFDFTWPS